MHIIYKSYYFVIELNLLYNYYVNSEISAKWIMDIYPIFGTDWEVLCLLPIDYVLNYIVVTGPNDVLVKYCEPDQTRICENEEVNTNRITIENENSNLKMTLKNVTVSDSGLYNWTVFIKNKTVTFNENKFIIVRKPPSILQFKYVPPNVSDLFEGQSVNFFCQIETGHISDVTTISLFNSKFEETNVLDFYNNSHTQMYVEILKSFNVTFQVVEGDNLVECSSVNKFGDKAFERVWLVVLITQKVPNESSLEIFCFTDYQSLYKKHYKFVSEICWKDYEIMTFNNSQFVKAQYSRFFTLKMINAMTNFSGTYHCQLKFCYQDNCTMMKSCYRNIVIFKKMNLTYCDIKDPAVVDQELWFVSIGFPGEYWNSSFLRIFLHDIPKTWLFQPPLMSRLKLNSTIVYVNMTFQLPNEPIGYSSVNICCILVNNENLPSSISLCLIKPVIRHLSGFLYTIPQVATNDRVKVNTKIRCTGVYGTPSPVYLWKRMSNVKEVFQTNLIPDLITDEEWLIVDNRSSIRGKIYKYRCLASQPNISKYLDVQFIVTLCNHEPLLDINLAINTQIHTTCGIDNKPGTEFFSMIYKPLLRRLILSLPVSPRKTRISLIPFLNYQLRHNATLLSLRNSLHGIQIAHLLELFSSQYPSPFSKPCDGMLLPCSGKGFRELYQSLVPSRENIPSIAIIGRDISACIDYKQDRADITRYSRLLKDKGISVWLHYFSTDNQLLKKEETIIKPQKTYQLINNSITISSNDKCCDLLKYHSLFSINGEYFLHDICSASSVSYDPLQNPILIINPFIYYNGLEIEINCSGNPGQPNGIIYFCLAHFLDNGCSDLINGSLIKNISNEMQIQGNLTLEAEYENWYIVCIATNDVQTEYYDKKYFTSSHLTYFSKPMSFIFINVNPTSVTEGKEIEFKCSFNIPIPPPLITLSLQKFGRKDLIFHSEQVYPKFTNRTHFEEQLVLREIKIILYNITNDWDECLAICSMNNSQNQMSADKTILVEWTLVRQPSLDFKTGMNYDMRTKVDNSSSILQEGYYITVNCSGKVGNGNSSIQLIVDKMSGQIWIINDREECYFFKNETIFRSDQYKCSEIRLITRNENYREILFSIPKISVDDQWINFTCISTNSLNSLLTSKMFRIFLDARINWIRIMEPRKIYCNASGNPLVEIQLQIISSSPADLVYLIQNLHTYVYNVSNFVIAYIEIPQFVKGLIIVRCSAENIVDGESKRAFFDHSFFFPDINYNAPPLQIMPSLASTNDTVKFVCSLNTDFYYSIRYVIIYQSIATMIKGVEMFPLAVRRVHGNDFFTFSFWKSNLILNNTIIYMDQSSSWDIIFIPSSRWISGLYYCAVVYEGGFKEFSSPMELKIYDIPSKPLIIIKSNGSIVNSVVEGQNFTVVCLVNIGLPEENGYVTLKRNGSQIREDRYILLSDSEDTQQIKIIKTEFATKSKHSNVVYECEATNMIGSNMMKTYPLITNFPPSHIQFDPKDKYIFRSNENIMCSADSIPIANFHWQLLTGPLGSQDKYIDHRFSYVKESLLILSSLNSGLYSFECQAFNKFGKVSRSITFFITSSKEMKDSVKYSPQFPTIGGHLSLFCLSIENMDSSSSISEILSFISWFKSLSNSNISIPLISYNFTTGDLQYHVPRHRFFIKGPFHFRLDILNITEADFGNYGCKIIFKSNALMTMLTEKEVCVLKPPHVPKITVKNYTECFEEGEDLSIECNGESGRLICERIISRHLKLVLNILYFPKVRPKSEDKYYLDITNSTAGTLSFYRGSRELNNVSFNLDNAVMYCSLEGYFSDDGGNIISWQKLFEEQSSTSGMNSLSKSTRIHICIFFSPRNIHIEPSVDKVLPGTKIICSALGNPSPLLYWKTGLNWTSKSGLDMGFIIVPLNVAPGLFKAICYAMNKISGIQRKISLSIEISIFPSEEKRWNRLILMVIGISALVLIILVGCCFVLKFFDICLLLLSCHSYNQKLEDSGETDISIPPKHYAPKISQSELNNILEYYASNVENIDDHLDCIEPPSTSDPFLTSYPMWKIIKKRSIDF